MISKLPVSKDRLLVYVLSDSSGETATQVIQAALVQFGSGVAIAHRVPQVRSSLEIREIVREVAGHRGLIAFTLVLPEYRQTLLEEARIHDVQTIDLLGPLITRIADLTATAPLSEPGRLHLLDDRYFQRMEAVNFAVRFDDGKDISGLAQADVVLLGVSRTSKTPNCMYLAQHHGLKPANVPLVQGIEPPGIIFRLPRKKLIGLNIDPHHLFSLRSSRARIMGMPANTDYTELEEIRSEVSWARDIFRKLGCHIIDVSHKAIEETSSEIAHYLNEE